MEKKITIRLEMENSFHREVYERLMNRDRTKFKSNTDYVCAAISLLEDPDGQKNVCSISAESRREIIDGVIEALKVNGYAIEAGI